MLAVATTLGFLGDLWWGFDLLANLRPQYAGALLVATGVLAAARVWPVAALGAAAAAANVAVLVPLYLVSPAPAATGGDVLQVMGLNVKIHGADPAAVAEYLRGAEDDLVYLFATNPRWRDLLRAADIPYRVVVAQSPGVDLEIILLARDDLAVTTLVHHWGESNRSSAVEATVELDGAPVVLLGMHPVSPVQPDRSQTRDGQLRLIARWAALQESPAVVVGDLNATPWSGPFRALLRDGDLENSQRGYGLQASWPAGLGPLGLPIDHALHSPELTTVERWLGPSFGSPHRAVHVRLARAAAG